MSKTILFNISYISPWTISTKMRDKVMIKTSGVVLILLALSLTIFSSEVHAEVIPEVVNFEENRAYIDTSPGSASTSEVNVTIRSPFRERMIFQISSELEGGIFWSAEHPDSIMIPPLGQKDMVVEVHAPFSEKAGKTVTLTIIAEADNDRGQWSNDMDIEVLPFVMAELDVEEDYLVDMPLEGEFNVTVANNGNIDMPISIEIEKEVGIESVGEFTVSPGDDRKLKIPYDLSDLEGETDWKIVPSSGNMIKTEPLDIHLIRDGSLLHFLFDVGPVLVILPTPLDDSTDFRLLALGGDISGVGIESVEGLGGIDISYEIPLEMNNLDRLPVDVEARGSGEIDFIRIRAYGYSEGERIESNQIPIPVEAKEESEGVDTGMIIRGSAVGGAGLLVGITAYLYAASEVFRYRWLAILFIPLYAAAKKDKILDHFFRGRLYEYVKENPGITYTALKKHFDVNNGTLTYHLHKLEKEEILAHKNVGKYKLFYPDGVKMRGAEVVISVLDKEILELVSDNPGITTSGITQQLKGARSKRTLSRHIKELERKDLIQIIRDDGKRKVYLADGWDKVILSSRGVTDIREDLSLDI